MRKKISSISTNARVILAYVIYIICLAGVILKLYQGSDRIPYWIILIILVFIIPLFFRDDFKFVNVYLDTNNLYIKRFKKNDVIQLIDVVDVYDNKWTAAHPVCIKVKSKSKFGKKIYFIPSREYAANYWFTTHPIVAELKKIVKEGKYEPEPKSVREDEEKV